MRFARARYGASQGERHIGALRACAVVRCRRGRAPVGQSSMAHGLPLRLLAAVKGPLPGVPLSLSPLPPACNALQVAVVGLSVVAPDILSPCN